MGEKIDNLIERLVRKQGGESLTQQVDSISNAWREQTQHASGEYRSWVMEVYSDHVIVCVGDDYYSVPYSRTDSETTFDVASATPVERTWTEVSKRMEIAKVDEEKQIAFGWAYVAERDGEIVEDHSGEFIAKEDLEDAAYVFNLTSREGDERHTEAVAAVLVESFVATPEKLEKMGLSSKDGIVGWWTGWYVPDPDVFAKIKNGEYRMLSIGGHARKEVAA